MKYFSERHLSINIRTRNDAYDDNQDFPPASTLLIHVTPVYSARELTQLIRRYPFLYHTYSIMSMTCLTNKLIIESTGAGREGIAIAGASEPRFFTSTSECSENHAGV